MRFIDRALGALRYHRRAYLGELLVALLFCAASLLLLSCQVATAGMRAGFSDRLAQFDDQALAQATSVLDTVKQTYVTLDQRYTWGWWGLVAAVTLLGFGFALWFNRRRRRETTAYLMVGKPLGDIAAQYLLESVLVFTLAFAGLWLLCALAGATLSNALHQLAQATFTTRLDRALSSASALKDITRLMHAHLTSFNGPGLLRPAADPAPTTTISGSLQTLTAGLGALFAGQGLGWGVGLTRLRRHLQRTAPTPQGRP
ncbi:hypothetical protein [Lacticaseibacillus absianus]|uniref:hypothetical protein n=1 Tax=Lacticaseibacillus absianus TaxID=2729623 RepID=UPI0015C96E82|nr:hypothetical protein [Lacticaseibacillus absianus]